VATTPLTLEQILIQLPETPRRIAALTAGVAPAKLRKSSVRGEWSANEVLAHLRACADVWGNHIVTIIRDEMPSWQAVSPRTWIEQTDYVELQFAPSLRAFTTQRADLMAALEPLPRTEWSRGAMVSGGGPTYKRTVLYYAERLARHERAHVKQVGRIVQALQR
jgi:DinB superfamily